MAEHPGYELKDAVALFVQQTTIINNLWTVYVVATFAIAGFGVSAGAQLTKSVAVMVTVGFWAFTLGHGSLLFQALSINQKLMSEISSTLLTTDPSFRFRSSLDYLSKTANLPLVSMAIHLLIDVCATTALWTRVNY